MSEMKVTVTAPIETHEVPAEKFSLKALGLDAPENANRGFLLSKNGRECLIVLGVDVCNRLTLDHKICVGGEPVSPGWGYGVDIEINQKGKFEFGADGMNHVRVRLYPEPTQMKYIRSEIQTALLAQGLFKIEVEEIIPEADYASRPAVAQSEHDDDDDEYDDDQPF